MFGGDSHVHCGGIPDDLSEACERSHSGPRFRLTPQRFRAQNRSRADSTTRFPPEQNQQDGPTCREGEMQAPDRDLLQVLKFELQFLEQGKYRSPLQWRPRYIFEDSPTCRRGRSSVCDCSECLLFDFVPPVHRSAPTPWDPRRVGGSPAGLVACRHRTTGAATEPFVTESGIVGPRPQLLPAAWIAFCKGGFP